jgi:enediyne biosynthesis protein E4
VAAGRHWIDLELEGTKSNRSAIGARIDVTFAGRTQRQDVLAASGFSAQNQRRIHVGLGDANAVDRVTIVWPSGQRQVLERPAVDQVHRVKEPA